MTATQTVVLPAEYREAFYMSESAIYSARKPFDPSRALRYDRLVDAEHVDEIAFALAEMDGETTMKALVLPAKEEHYAAQLSNLVQIMLEFFDCV